MSTPSMEYAAKRPTIDDVPLRVITATSLFDGHDAAINIIRRLIQDQGAEVIHLGHNRSVPEIVMAAFQEDVDAIALSSYQGGHMEFFRYLIEMLEASQGQYIRIFGGGGGTITAAEASELEACGVEKIYTPEDGIAMGLEGMVRDLMVRTHRIPVDRSEGADVASTEYARIGRGISRIEMGRSHLQDNVSLKVGSQTDQRRCPVIGVTGTGGSGKSTVIDELLLRLRKAFPRIRVALLAIDPTRQRSGGALLGDRICMNNVNDELVFMRSMATRRSSQLSYRVVSQCTAYLRKEKFDLILVETPGIGQGDAQIIDYVDLSLYIMTSEYGAPGQLEKIEMLDCADFVALNKFDRPGAADALRSIRKQWCRNHKAFDLSDEQIPVYPTVGGHCQDEGIGRLFRALCERLADITEDHSWRLERDSHPTSPVPIELIPSTRAHYLVQISAHGRAESQRIDHQVQLASRAHAYYLSLVALRDEYLPAPLGRYEDVVLDDASNRTMARLRRCYQRAVTELDTESIALLRRWPETKAGCSAASYRYQVRGRELHGEASVESLSHLRIPKIALPQTNHWGELLRFLLQENLPGFYPYTGGVFPYRRLGELPMRMFAGEGSPERTNRRFHYLIRGQSTIRLSTAFDPITLYGEDPQTRADVYGRIGMSGVSIATVDDVKILYSGIDLCRPDASVSMTINGPAPAVLAMLMNAAIDQQVEKYLRSSGHWNKAFKKIKTLTRDRTSLVYQGELPKGHDSLGLGMLGVSGSQLLGQEAYARLKADVFARLRGTLQADILKEDQAQNECIFATDFALRMMADIQAFFIAQGVKNFYSVSVSGYHIAEAGANPITQLAFTLANGFTLVEYYMARGMAIDEIAPHMSFFFSNGMDPEYAVIGRVARRVWARAMRHVYHASLHNQRLKYHIQTSGRSLHAEEIAFNDIRTTLQALYATLDNCNSLHTNAYDEAVTTPTQESVRRALAIQMIINQELGLNDNQNPLQGSFIIEYLTDKVEEAVYREFDRLNERGGVLGAMDNQYQRGRIQDESLYYEQRRHDGSLPLVGVNTFLSPSGGKRNHAALIRSSEQERRDRIRTVDQFKAVHARESPQALERLKGVVQCGGNAFNELMQTVQCCSLGQITGVLYQVGGKYRRRL